MTKKEGYESRTEAFLLPLMEKHRFELVDVEYVKEGGTWFKFVQQRYNKE